MDNLNDTEVMNELNEARFGKLIESFPVDLLDAYWNEFKIKDVFPWQVECLSLEPVRHGRNLIFSAPTSAGKSLVADLLMLRHLT